MTDVHIFEPEYYRRLYEIEAGHWWSIGMRSAMQALLAGVLDEPRTIHLPDNTHDPVVRALDIGIRALDIGCGTGFLMNVLADTPAIKEVAGLDYSLDALRFCRLRGLSHLLQGDAGRLPHRTGSFDLIVCIDTLQHLSPAGADREGLGEMARLLRPGGMLYLRTNSALGHRRLRGVDPARYRRYRREQLIQLVESAGLQVHRATYLNCLPSLWATLKEMIRPAGEASRAGPGLAIRMTGNRCLAQALERVLRFEAWLVGRVGLDLPFGHSLAVVARKSEPA